MLLAKKAILKRFKPNSMAFLRLRLSIATL